MNAFTAILALQFALVLIVAVALAVVVCSALKAGGSVEITLPAIKVKWGGLK